MTEKPANAPPAGINVGDILHVVFRHKWKISLISAAGVAAAALLSLFSPVPYQSEAKLFVKYVVENKAPSQGAANDPRAKLSIERSGENIVNNEVEILSSLDLAEQVAEKLQPDLLVRLGGKTNTLRAAAAIQRGLLLEVGRKSDVIHVVFRQPDPLVVQPVLKLLIETYLARQAEIHSAAGLYDDPLTRQRDDLRSRLSTTQEELRKAKEKAGSIFSVDDTKKTYADQLAKIEQEILDATAKLAERKAEVSAIEKLLPSNSQPVAALAALSITPAGTNSASTPNASASVPSEKQDEYRRLLGLLESLDKRDQELRLQFTPENLQVKGVEEQIANAEKLRKKLEDETPGLITSKAQDLRTPPLASASPAPGLGPRLDLITEAASIPALESEIHELTNQLARIRVESASLSAAESAITDLELTRKVQEAQYNYFQKALDELHADEQLGAGRTSNIIPIQTASPAIRSASTLHKAIAMVLFGCVGAAFALAFAIEFYLDPSIKRPIEIETRLGLPLFISIPRLSLNGNGKLHGLPWARSKIPLLGAGNGGRNGGPKTNDGAQKPADEEPKPANGEEKPFEFARQSVLNATGSALCTSRAVLDETPHSLFSGLAPWDPRHPMHSFSEALRDRIITFFEVHGLTHKPKLVALTSCSEGSGVTTIAAGLAASLSETGEGNVLLVNMSRQGAAHQFYRGELACGLEVALEADTRGGALVHENLYIVTEGNGAKADRLPQALPRRFKHLVPRLKASDYDYIIFDMPPISQISVTPRLARFMDMVLIVAESEKTDRSVVKRAGAMLAESKANVGIILNKNRTYVPRRLLQEL